MRELGRVVRLQIQRSSLKTGAKPNRAYDPAPILPVERLAITAEGVLGEAADRSWLVDVHHRAHPDTKNPDGQHGVSLGFTTHYVAMRDRFGHGHARPVIEVEEYFRSLFSHKCSLASQ